MSFQIDGPVRDRPRPPDNGRGILGVLGAPSVIGHWLALSFLAGCHLVSPLAPAPADASGADAATEGGLDGSGPEGPTGDGPAADGQGWTRVYKLQPGTCPSGWTYDPGPGGCSIGGTLDCGWSGGNSVELRVTPPAPYREVRGHVQGVQYFSTDAFATDLGSTIDDPYVEGVSFTRGDPRQHLWTFASGLYRNENSPGSCPGCSPNAEQPPAFVGASWTCDSGNTETYYDKVWYTGHPLWGADSTGPGCARPGEPGWFQVALPAATSDYIEVRILFDGCDENIAVTELELYVR